MKTFPLQSVANEIFVWSLKDPIKRYVPVVARYPAHHVWVRRTEGAAQLGDSDGHSEPQGHAVESHGEAPGQFQPQSESIHLASEAECAILAVGKTHLFVTWVK